MMRADSGSVTAVLDPAQPRVGAKPVSCSSTPAGSFPAKFAYLSAAIFATASGAINVTYGWQRGADLPSSLTWAAVAGAVAIAFTLSWSALIRSEEAFALAR